MLAPSINIEQARNPGHSTGAAPIGKCVTGPALCMKNTALCDLIAASEISCSSFRFAAIANSFEKRLNQEPETELLFRKRLFVLSITSWAES
jgi:hypothetical protein